MFIIQMTGLSGAGKTTLAEGLKNTLQTKGVNVIVIDADMYRKTINKDLGFSAADRKENIRRLANVAEEYRQKGVLTIIAAINPFEDIRKEIAERVGAKTVWVHCDLDVLIKRDTKGLYKRALLPDNNPNKIHNLTGINDTYEIPLSSDLIIDTTGTNPAYSAHQLLMYTEAELKLCQVS